ncbi:MAG: 30S ribosomal protein S9 [bacterium]
MTEVKKTTKKEVVEVAKFKGRYIEEIGKRKSAAARVRLYKTGEGVLIVNGKKLEEYFNATCANLALTSLKLTSHTKDIDLSIIVNGGGLHGQAEAVRHGISKALVTLDKNLRPSLKAKGMMTRDSRIKERKKPGLKKARKAPQWAKR